MSHCPVCGMKTKQGSAFFVQHDIGSYFFCSLLCKQTFEAQPAIYMGMKLARIHDRHEELEHIRQETIACLSRAAEYKDNETGKHTMRIAAYAKLLANLADLDAEQVCLICDTAPMHDVGKIGIPEHILLKPARLDTAERAIMEQHAEIGAKILGNHAKSQLMKMAVSIAITHHEKWSGKGYPKGLQGTAIPIEGRIVAICDVFDALISERPYKKAWSESSIKTWMGEESGKHFDPALLSLFLEHFSQFCTIYHRLSDKTTLSEQP